MPLAEDAEHLGGRIDLIAALHTWSALILHLRVRRTVPNGGCL
jgi:hypothetical protein